MKLYNVKKGEFAEFYASYANAQLVNLREQKMSKALHKALSTYGVQAEYVTEFINDWLTAYHAAEVARDRRERSVFRSATENTRRYCADILRKCGNSIDDCDDLALHRVLELTWTVFVRREREKTNGGKIEEV